MAEVRDAVETYAEQVETAQQAVSRGEANAERQQAQAAAWQNAGLPEDAAAVTPGPGEPG